MGGIRQIKAIIHITLSPRLDYALAITFSRDGEYVDISEVSNIFWEDHLSISPVALRYLADHYEAICQDVIKEQSNVNNTR